MRPEKPEQECPTCHWTSFLNKCDKGRQRILADKENVWYKAVTCPLWQEKVVEKPVERTPEKPVEVKCPRVEHE
jgi:hypothetical protein